MSSPNVLFIGGAGRSGSTLLALMLGELEGYHTVGEITFVWDRGLIDDQLCGCGEPFGDCEVWRAIVEEAFGSLSSERVERLHRLKERLCRTYRVPQLLAPELRTRRLERDLAEYAGAMDRLFEAVAEVTGAETIVDSSKNPAEASVLHAGCQVDLDIVHLVRDSRGVAHSWQRKRERPEIHWKEAYMPRYSSLTTSAAWNIYNGLFEHLGDQPATGYERVRYEDLTDRPIETLEGIVEMVSEDPPPIASVTDHTVHLTTNHTVSGNPLRFETGDIELRRDRAWRDEMAGWRRQFVTGVTYPMLRRYAYL